MPEPDPETGYAAVYDTIRGDDPAFRASQIAFLCEAFAGCTGPLLDAGCGTGRHLVFLKAAGYCVVGLDISPAMLAVARVNLAAAGLPARLVRGDLRALPFQATFGGILCLESPLAYLLNDVELALALGNCRRTLHAGGALVVDIFDYAGMFGERGLRPRTTRFSETWGHVDVRESHRYDRVNQIWEMRQAFTVVRSGRQAQFAVRHRLRIRSADAYAAALERAGFTVEKLLPCYPGTPPELHQDPRMIFVARAK